MATSIGTTPLPRLLAVLLLAAPVAARADGLGEYKDQKHEDRERVTAETCEEAYIARCVEACGPRDAECRAECEQEAPGFCEERKKRKTRKTIEVAVKAASVGAGAAAVAVENALTPDEPASVATTGVPVEDDPLTIYWNRPSATFELGGGYIAHGANAGAGTFAFGARKGLFGASGLTTFLADGEDWLMETDVGPSLFIHSNHIIFGGQPSLLLSSGNDVQTELGFGVRSFTSVHLGPLVLHFDPMLGVINRQWAYHLRVGASWRFTPVVYARVSYDYRDVLDLGDLDISQASLQGVIATVGFRFN